MDREKAPVGASVDMSTYRKWVATILGLISNPQSGTADSFDIAVLDSDRKVRLSGYLILASVFGIGGVLVAALPLESAARAAGVVQVAGNRKPVQHYEGGIVDEILVAEGERVAEGQALIRLDSTQVDAEHRIVEGRVWAARARLDRLIAERDDALQISFDPWLAGELDDRASVARNNEIALFAARKADRLGEEAVQSQRIKQLESMISGATAIVDAKQKILHSMRVEEQQLRELLDEGYVDQQRVIQLERSIAQLLGEIADLVARLEADKVAILEAEMRILQLRKRFKTQVVDLLGQAQEEFYDMEQRLLTIKNRQSRMLVTAPTSGFILDLKPNITGAVVSPGEVLLRIVPDVKDLVISARLAPMDMDRISIGQEAEVLFAVFKDAYAVTGTLVAISPDILEDAGGGLPYFEGKVKLAEEDIALLGEHKLVPGMPAEVLVKTGTRTFLGYLTSPLARMFENSLIED